MPPTDYSRVNRFVQPGSAVTVIKKKKKGAAPTKLDQDEAERYVVPVGLEFRIRSLNRGLGHHCVAPEF